MTIQKLICLAVVLAALACDSAQKPTVENQSADGGGMTVAPGRPMVERDMATQRMSKGMSASAQDADFAQGSPPDAPPVSVQPDAAATPAMMIRTGYATLEVSKLDPAILEVRALATKVGGFITNSSTSGGRDQIRAAMLEIRIPAQRYDEAVAGLSAIGRVEATQTNAQDVGEEFVDVTARVENARKLETRLIELLANRTGRLQDVLAVERELARVRTEIDQMEGRLRFLKNRVALSTLTVNLHEPQPLIGNTPGENPISSAVRQAWRNFVGFLASIIAALGVLIPLAILVALGWFGYKRLQRRLKH